MAELSVYIEGITRLIVKLPQELQTMLSVAAKDAKALIEDRVTKRGIAADGEAFTPYSESWAKVRAKKPRQTEYKDFLYTGNMWRGAGTKTLTPTEATVGASSADVHKIEHNNEREKKEIFDLSEKERELIARNIETKLAALLNAV